MSDLVKVQAVVLSSQPIGEYDRRIVLLTRERGKIAAFAKGARKPQSSLLAASTPFVFGDFWLYEGRTSYTVVQAAIRHHFVELASLQPAVYYAYYFMEVADYFGREGNDEKEMMNLLYVSLKALTDRKLDPRLVRCLYELRVMAEQGMTPRLWDCGGCQRKIQVEPDLFFSLQASGLICGDCHRRYRNGAMGEGGRSDMLRIRPQTLALLRYACTAPLGRLYGFTTTKELPLQELEGIAHPFLLRSIDRKLKSLQILELMA